MNKLERALLVAEKAHANQHYDIYPYMFHIKQVVGVAKELGYDESVLVSCALHDVMEDGDLSYNDIKKGFGEEVAEIVYAVTDELGRNRKERKEKTYLKIKANIKATVVKICDRIANVSHSKEYNKRLFDMYYREHADFAKELLNSHPDVTKAFDKLNELWKN